MLKLTFLLLAIVVGAVDPPDPSKLIETFEVNLDLPPEQRWVGIVKEKRKSINLLLGVLKEMFDHFDVTDELIAAYNSSVSDEYRREMQGMAASIDVAYRDAVMANLFYEISGVTDSLLDLSRSCTSIVAQRANGTVYFARNQDYPPPFTLVMIHAKFTKNNKMVYEGTTYAGTIGLSTAAVPNSWSVSINARGNPCRDGLKACQKAAVDAAASGAQIFPIYLREALDVAGSDYDAAKEFLTKRDLIMPGYTIFGGVNPGEGAVITRNMSGNTTDVLHLFDSKVQDGGGGDWYVVQTNTDHWVPTSKNSRRTTATNYLDKVGNKNIDLIQLWDVLGTPPVYNEATIHTDLISEKWNEYRTYKRHGPLYK